MRLTNDEELDGLLWDLLGRMRAALGGKLVGLYLYGSLAAGDFDRGSSDIDLLAVTSSDVEEGEFERLREMQDGFVGEHAEWDDRLEIAYLSAEALRTFRERASRAAVVSPGEPFHFRESEPHWLIDWRTAREKGVTLFGPPPSTFIGPVSREEFLRAVREQAERWRGWSEGETDRAGQAYAILTLCRALHAHETGEQASKPRAARWAQERLPRWAPLIEDALAWRAAWRDDGGRRAAVFPETAEFISLVIERIAGRGAG
jgi:predicted nucleotidyltransferase